MEAQALRLGGLKSKIFVLIAVPLFFEVLVACSLMFLQHLYVQSVEAESTRKIAIYMVNRMWRQSVNMLVDNSALTFEIKESSDSHWKNDYNAILKHYSELKPLIKDKEHSRRLDELKDFIDRIHTLSKPPDKAIALDLSSPEDLDDIAKALISTKKMTRASLQIAKEFRKFKEPLLAESRESQKRVDQARLFVDLALGATVFGSIALAALLFRYFMNNVYGEIKALNNSIDAFAGGTPLKPVPAEGDELVLLHQRFFEATKTVEETQKRKREFVQTISQFLRDPLNRVLHYFDSLSLAGDALDRKTLEGALRSKKSLERLITLLDDLVALNERVRPQLDINQTVVDLNGLVKSSVESMQLQGMSCSIEIEPFGNELKVFADEARITQVLVNLLSNAIKFSPAGATIVVSVMRQGEFAEIRVKDSGRGIPESHQHAIFEAFKQVAISDGTKKGGTGLGLPICKHIVERHGGEIGVHSVVDRGSTFWFRIPLAGSSQ